MAFKIFKRPKTGRPKQEIKKGTPFFEVKIFLSVKNYPNSAYEKRQFDNEKKADNFIRNFQKKNQKFFRIDKYITTPIYKPIVIPKEGIFDCTFESKLLTTIPKKNS